MSEVKKSIEVDLDSESNFRYPNCAYVIQGWCSGIWADTKNNAVSLDFAKKLAKVFIDNDKHWMPGERKIRIVKNKK